MPGVRGRPRAQAHRHSSAVKLLIDHNLSSQLVPALRNLYPGSVHVRDQGMQTASNETVWGYAREHGFAIVSKDADFHQRSLVLGAPPKFIWTRRWNCSTNEILGLLTEHHPRLIQFDSDSDAAFMALG